MKNKLIKKKLHPFPFIPSIHNIPQKSYKTVHQWKTLYIEIGASSTYSFRETDFAQIAF